MPSQQSFAVICTGHQGRANYTAYDFRIRHGGGCEWTIQRRYQELADLHERLSTVFGVTRLPRFPPKTGVGPVEAVGALLGWAAKNSKDVVAERVVAFQTYFDGLAAREDVGSTACFQAAVGVVAPEPVRHFRLRGWLPTDNTHGATALLEIRPEGQTVGSSGIVVEYHVTARLVLRESSPGTPNDTVLPLTEAHAKALGDGVVRLDGLPRGATVELDACAMNAIGKSATVSIRLLVPAGDRQQGERPATFAPPSRRSVLGGAPDTSLVSTASFEKAPPAANATSSLTGEVEMKGIAKQTAAEAESGGDSSSAAAAAARQPLPGAEATVSRLVSKGDLKGAIVAQESLIHQLMQQGVKDDLQKDILNRELNRLEELQRRIAAMADVSKASAASPRSRPSSTEGSSAMEEAKTTGGDAEILAGKANASCGDAAASASHTAEASSTGNSGVAASAIDTALCSTGVATDFITDRSSSGTSGAMPESIVAGDPSSQSVATAEGESEIGSASALQTAAEDASSDLEQRRIELEQWWAEKKREAELADAARERQMAEFMAQKKAFEKEREEFKKEEEQRMAASPTPSPPMSSRGSPTTSADLETEVEFQNQRAELQRRREEVQAEALRAEEARTKWNEEVAAQQVKLDKRAQELTALEACAKGDASELLKELEKQREDLKAEREEQSRRDKLRMEAETQQTELGREREELMRQLEEQKQQAADAAEALAARERDLERQQAALEARQEASEAASEQAEKSARLESELKEQREEFQRLRADAEKSNKEQADTLRQHEAELLARAEEIVKAEEALQAERHQILRSRASLALVQAHVLESLDRRGPSGGSPPPEAQVRDFEIGGDEEDSEDAAGEGEEVDAGDGEDCWSSDWAAIGASRATENADDGAGKGKSTAAD
eukprot:gnl/TRDRNA2_/TRDRNA2_165469_c0_seq1.p1 gnl/TRDRNA2_/TRDRNA2_165469_c0~~gnl/TRDRNA2_/TRDRNA2_165469_c0_seq1.p1  ORF type:complete len:907 (-),score=239.58 gnl/TRDRNA2_/TRDRNA2_165469_c0_seq1:81-2801(-)